MTVPDLQETAETFSEMRSRAESAWRELWNGGKPAILVGTATCGRAAGSLAVLRAIKDEIKRSHIRCSVIEVGLHGALLRRADGGHQQAGIPPYLLRPR